MIRDSRCMTRQQITVITSKQSNDKNRTCWGPFTPSESARENEHFLWCLSFILLAFSSIFFRFRASFRLVWIGPYEKGDFLGIRKHTGMKNPGMLSNWSWFTSHKRYKCLCTIWTSAPVFCHLFVHMLHNSFQPFRTVNVRQHFR